MSAPMAARALSRATRKATSTARARVVGKLRSNPRAPFLALRTPPLQRYLSASVLQRARLTPESADPPPPNPEEHEGTVIQQATELEDEEYHTLADEYMEAVHEKAEALQEAREDVDVEYSAGVLSINMPPNGTYIINKQPPNKQIWLSSPTSGPKRFDWVVSGESMHQKEGGGTGDWVYIRDGSSLTDLLKNELGIDLDLHGHEEDMKQSRDQTE